MSSCVDYCQLELLLDDANILIIKLRLGRSDGNLCNFI